MALRREHDRLRTVTPQVKDMRAGIAVADGTSAGTTKPTRSPVRWAELTPEERLAMQQAWGREGAQRREELRKDVLESAIRLGLGRYVDQLEVATYWPRYIEEAAALDEAECRTVAALHGGGELPLSARMCIRHACNQSAAASFLSDMNTRQGHAWDGQHDKMLGSRVTPRTNLELAAARLSNEARLNFIAARDIARLDAEARLRVVPASSRTWAELAADAGKPRKAAVEVEEDDDDGSES